jgi:hypothetical protein
MKGSFLSTRKNRRRSARQFITVGPSRDGLGALALIFKLRI